MPMPSRADASRPTLPSIRPGGVARTQRAAAIRAVAQSPSRALPGPFRVVALPSSVRPRAVTVGPTHPAASLQPGECASYSGEGGQSFNCCKGRVFATISCITYDYPGGKRRRIQY